MMPFIWLKLESGDILDANHTASVMLGYSLEELKLKKVTDFRKSADHKPFIWSDHVEVLKKTYGLKRHSYKKRRIGILCASRFKRF